MSVYVDSLRRWGRGPRCFAAGSCHLVADTEAELHAFAQQIGLKRQWFQIKRRGDVIIGIPHYDLTVKRRAAAVLAGALEVDGRRLVEVGRALRESMSTTTTDGEA